MHIVIATPAFPPFVGGGERHTGTLARHLISRGHRVTVLTSSAEREPDFWLGRGQITEVEIEDQGLHIIRMPLRPMPGGFQGLLLWRKAMVILSTLPGTLGILQKMASRVPGMFALNQALDAVSAPVDIVHGFNISWEYAMLAGWRYARRAGIPFVASPLAHLGTGPTDRVALNTTMRHQIHLLSSADLLLTNTAVEAAGLADRGVRQPATRVAGPGVDIPADVAALPAAGEALKPYVIFVGRTSYDKGAIHAAQAVLRLRERGFDLNLVLIGRETDEFRRYFADLPASSRQAIHILGFVEESVKHAYIRDAEALLLPSRSDSFGIVLLEAWYHRRPVIAANAGGVPAVVDDGVNGLLVPFGDVPSLSAAIASLVSNQDFKRTMGEQGWRKMSDNFTWDVVTEKVLDAYQETLAGKRATMDAPDRSGEVQPP